MRQSRSLALPLLILCTITALAPAEAFAENPQFLKLGGGSPTFPIGFAGNLASGNAAIETSVGTVTCTKESTSGGEITSLTLGKSALLLEGCTLSTNKEKCNSAGDVAGVILVPSTAVHLVAYKTGAELLAGLLFLAISVEFTCGAVKVKVAGGVIGLLGPLNVDATSFTLLFDHTGVTQKPTSCELPTAVCLPGGKTALYSLLTNLGLGLEHSILLAKSLYCTATDLLIDG